MTRAGSGETRPRVALLVLTPMLLGLGPCPLFKEPDDLLEGITARVLVIDVDRERVVVLQLGDVRRQSRTTTTDDALVEFALDLAPGAHDGTIVIVRDDEHERCGALSLSVTDGQVDTTVIDASELADCDEEGAGEDDEDDGEDGEGEGDEDEQDEDEGEDGDDGDTCDDDCIEIAPDGIATCSDECNFFCGDGCRVSNDGDAIDLELQCAGGSCDVVLTSSVDSSAEVTCDGERCDVIVSDAAESDVLVLCDNGACDLTCTDLDDGTCTLRCAAGTTCTIACNAVSSCHLECEAGATCTVNECIDSGLCGPFSF